MKIKFIVLALAAMLLSVDMTAQQQLTKEQILNMSIEELSELPLEDLMQAVETLGVSSVDELFAMIMNKNVSSASKKEEDTFTSPLSSTVITKNEMRTYGVTSIEEAFRLIPGMIVTEKTNGMYDVQMRGLNNIPDNNMYLYTENANTLIMIDGRPVQSYVMGSCNFDVLPISIEDIERIEVVRGACGALYGANAVTGVINILTEKPGESSNLISGNIQMGSQNTYIGDFAVRKAFNNKIAAGLTVNMQHRERPTDKLYVIPGQSGLFYCDNNAIMPEPGAVEYTVYSSEFDKEFRKYKTSDPQTYLALYQQKALLLQQRLGVMQAGNGVGGYYNVSEIDQFKQFYPEYDDQGQQIVSYRIFDAKEPETPGANMFPSPELARKQAGINAYITLTPAPDVTINITGGYQNSEAKSTPVGDDIFSFNGRISKTGHATLDASIKDLRVLANYHGGVQNYAEGVPGFKIFVNEFNASAEYDFNVGGLGIRPGISYQNLQYDDYVPDYYDEANKKWMFHDPGYKYKEGTNNHLSGFLTYGGKLETIAPSVRLDYKLGDVRLIGAYRADKTNIPDKWHHSWQFAASYSINDNNFIRLVYGRANRGTNLVNSTADFEWTRTNMVYPKRLHFEKNKEADFMKIDNIELGYRWKPSQKVLVDAELFYSISNNYGALMASSASMNVQNEGTQAIIMKLREGLNIYEGMFGGREGLAQAVAANPDLIKEALTKMISGSGDSYEDEGFDLGLLLEPYANIKYSSLPYKVNQIGLSFNVDYIISSKLIAKLNANFQNTTIDNYYVYNQTSDIQAMLGEAKGSATNELSQAFAGIIQQYLLNGKSVKEAADLVLGPKYNAKKNWSEFGNTTITHDDSSTPKSNGVKHKDTPSFYGMLGLIYKPMQQLEVSAFANFIGKRTYTTKYGAEKLDNRCTVNMKVGYKPIQQMELFFNAHNLFNTEKREFVYCDEIGGIYTIGVNFGF
ncbi:MAG: TonB-dependent receptor [Bacteroidales bacterium]|nr:TonB-dependent receptor [Bacteroidales bacterium]